jgi:hypothetical protein
MSGFLAEELPRPCRIHFEENPKEKNTMSDTGLKRVQIVIDPNDLYHEETYTDLKVGRIRKLTPVRIDGGPDKSRKPIFVGETQLGVKGQIIPIQCDIDARGLAEAVEKYPEAIEAAFEQIVKEAEKAKKTQKENESRIIVPKL